MSLLWRMDTLAALELELVAIYVSKHCAELDEDDPVRVAARSILAKLYELRRT